MICFTFLTDPVSEHFRFELLLFLSAVGESFRIFVPLGALTFFQLENETLSAIVVRW